MPRLTIQRNGHVHEVLFNGTPLLSHVLIEAGMALPQPCGGRGHCGKCGVDITGHISPPNQQEERAGRRLSCQITLQGDCHVVLPEQRMAAQIQTEGTGHTKLLSPMPGKVGAAVDLGTTTLALRLYSLENGNLLASAAGTNPQVEVAADVMSRIDAAMQGRLAWLEQSVLIALEALLLEAGEKAGIHPDEITSLVLTGNTTMLYLASGKTPKSLAQLPFQADTLFGNWCELLSRKTYLPHCMNAFVGADITCAVLASGMTEQDATSLLVDVGTNGEIALWKEGVLHVASTAAGPAFEGAGIYMGCSSQPGAVDSVWLEGSSIHAHTIAEEQAVGICGSGLLDAVAALLDLGLVDDTGAMEDQVTIKDTVVLLPRDIRAVQLAKAAIAAGIKTLMNVNGILPSDIHTFYLAGGFGSHLDLASAVRIGMISQDLADKAIVIGNAALNGAAMLLQNQNFMARTAVLAQSSHHVALGGNPMFNQVFIEEMMFPES